MPQPGEPQPRQRFGNIEALRGIAVTMVLVQHLPSLFVGSMAWWAPGGWLNRMNFSVGVDIFFCISGFVVARVLRRDFAGLKFREMLRYTSRFWMRRAFRLWPAAWLGLLVAYLLALSFNRLGTMDAAANLRLIPAGIGMYLDFHAISVAHHQGSIGTMGQYWSLSFEEQFYLLLPLLLMIAGRLTLPVLIIYVGLWWHVRMDFWTAILLRPGCLVAGVLLSYIEGGPLWRRLNFSRMPSRTNVVGINIFGCTAVCGLAAFVNAIHLDDRIHGVLVYSYAPFMVTLVCFILVFAAALDDTTAQPTRLGSVLMFVGSRSYILYIWHPVAYAMAQEVAFHIGLSLQPDWFHTMLLVALALIILGIITELTVRYVEQPLREFGRLLTDDNRTKVSRRSVTWQIIPKS